MPAFSLRLRTPVLVSILLILPFVVLELANRRAFGEAFPLPLFAGMWLLALAFMLVLTPVVRSASAETRTRSSSLGLLAGIAVLLLIAGLWAAILADQMPCFMGVPACD